MTSETLRFIFNQPLKQWLAEKKERKTEIEKFKYLENEKSFLDEKKKHFSWSLKGYHLVRNINLIKKIAGNSFKLVEVLRN